MTQSNHGQGRDLFQAAEARRLKEEGLLKVSSFPNDDWVSHARDFVVQHAKNYGEVSCIDVHRLLPPPSDAHPSIMGSVFVRQKKLRLIRYQPSPRKESHARPIAVYAYREGNHDKGDC